MLLKDIPEISKLKDSVIAKTTIWNKDVEQLSTKQLIAIRQLELIKDKNSKIDEEIELLVRLIQFAEVESLTVSPLSEYVTPCDRKINAEELADALSRMPEPYGLATIFGLEMKLSATRVSNLTIQQAHNLDDLTPLAKEVIQSSIYSIKTILLFWKEKDGECVGLDDLNEVVYGEFGYSWLELSKRYKNMHL